MARSLRQQLVSSIGLGTKLNHPVLREDEIRCQGRLDFQFSIDRRKVRFDGKS